MAITMTAREFNQNASLALKLSEKEPVFITKWGKIVSVVSSYMDYSSSKTELSLAEALKNNNDYGVLSDEDWEDFERTLTEIRKNSRHREVDFGE